MGENSRKKQSENIVVLGSTGSIGRSTLDALREQSGEFAAAGLAAGRASGLLIEQIIEFRPRSVVVRERTNANKILKSKKLDEAGLAPDVAYGVDGLETLAAMPKATKVVNALSGAVGIRPSVAAVGSGKTLLLANKEALVAAGAV
ncbi:MAG: hypothetical protein KAG97_13265, partial [Victivallales bacterium]|nr:hypothetical protein [Victivallales bacterium]